MQSVIALLATWEREFAGQSRQTELPVSILYVPAKQLVHAAPLFPVDPAMQMQAVIAVLATGEIEFSGQPRQAKLPVDALYVPVVQSTHIDLPLFALNLPVGQSRQAELPTIVLYVPAKQVVQSAPSFPVAPAAQVQALMLVLPVNNVVDHQGHVVQQQLPMKSLYLPMLQ